MRMQAKVFLSLTLLFLVIVGMLFGCSKVAPEPERALPNMPLTAVSDAEGDTETEIIIDIDVQGFEIYTVKGTYRFQPAEWTHDIVKNHVALMDSNLEPFVRFFEANS